jgi:hypothetical protein
MFENPAQIRLPIAARFLRHFSKGNGDYLQIQQNLFKGMRLDQIYKKAREHHEAHNG